MCAAADDDEWFAGEKGTLIHQISSLEPPPPRIPHEGARPSLDTAAPPQDPTAAPQEHTETPQDQTEAPGAGVDPADAEDSDNEPPIIASGASGLAGL